MKEIISSIYRNLISFGLQNTSINIENKECLQTFFLLNFQYSFQLVQKYFE